MKKILLFVSKLSYFCLLFLNLNINSQIKQLEKQNQKLRKNLLTDQLTLAILNKYECVASPSALSTIFHATQLTGPTVVDQQTIALSDKLGKQIKRFTNQYRASRGVPPLVWDESLAKICRGHTVKMARGIKPFSHAGFYSRFANYRKIQPTASAFGENLLYGSNIPADQIARIAVNAWISSPEHQANLVGHFNRIGVSIFENSVGVWYVSQEFAFVN